MYNWQNDMCYCIYLLSLNEAFYSVTFIFHFGMIKKHTHGNKLGNTCDSELLPTLECINHSL